MFIDTNIFMYAAGRASPWRAPCQTFLAGVTAGTAPPCFTNAEVLQEILHRYRSIGRADLGLRLFDAVVHLGVPILPVGESEVRGARRILESSPALSTRDGVHLGVMESAASTTLLSYDRGFDAVAWIRRIEPPPES